MEDSTQLCASCATLDLSFYREDIGGPPHEICLGVTDEIQERGNPMAGVPCAICSVVCGEIVGLVKDGTSRIILKPWDMGIEIYAETESSGPSPPQGTKQSKLLSELNVFKTPPSSIIVKEGGGSLVSGRVLKSMLSTCELRHHSTCGKAVTSLNRQRQMATLLIDVQKKCLVLVESTENTRYIALSYVWGGVDMLRTKRENMNKLMQEHSLKELEDQIPQVIRDTMDIVSLMGERYLWVDALCVVQNDPEWKHLQISQMDMIYSHATCTIVAGCTKHADERLPGVLPLHRWPTSIQVQGMTITRSAPQLDDALSGSIYESRAWTLQEKLLSRRCLFFFDQIVFFRCNAGVHRETEEEPIIKLSSTTSVRRANTVNPLTNLRKDRESWHIWQQNLQHYLFVLQDYTCRQLSYPSDILVAFYGLQSQITATAGLQFICGIPENVIDFGLLWYTSANLSTRRRMDPIVLSGSSTGIPPSWSWAGWEGKVTGSIGNNLNWTKDSPLRSLVESFEYEGPDGKHILNRDELAPIAYPLPLTEPQSQGTSYHSGVSKNPQSTLGLQNTESSTCLLIFNTDCIEFVGTTQLLSKNKASRHPDVHSWLRDEKGSKCVKLFNRVPSWEDFDVHTFQLIALSQFAVSQSEMESSGLEINRQRNWKFLRPSDRTDDHWWKDDDALRHMINVMIVSWKDGKIGAEKYAERLAVGQMHRYEWNKWNPVRKNIRLA